MPLVDTSRMTAADRKHWAKQERLDRLRAAQPDLEMKGKRARDDIEGFASGGPCYVSTSWGKDSIVVCDLACGLGGDLGLPLVWVRVPPVTNPDCTKVRDKFLAGRQGGEYWEVTSPVCIPHDVAPCDAINQRAFSLDILRAYKEGFAMAAKRFGDRYVSGIQAAESRVRKVAMCRLGSGGHADARTCRPIGWWSVGDVYSWIEKRGLPLHPTYGCTMGGVRDRERLRVDVIMGHRGRVYGREDYERRYYGREWHEALRELDRYRDRRPVTIERVR